MLLNVILHVVTICSTLQFYNSFPSLMRRLPGPHHKFLDIFNDTKEFIAEEVEQHKQKWDPSDPRDYIDCFLNEIEMVTDTRCRRCL